MIPVPENVVQIAGEIVGYKSEYNGKTYFHIRDTYTDKETGAKAIGKGVSFTPDEWEIFKKGFAELCKGLE